MTTPLVRIVPSEDHHIEGWAKCVDVVARERRYLALVEVSLDSAREFLTSLKAGGGVHYVAATPDNRVVGWCDIHRRGGEGFRHAGVLGIGLLPDHRGQGIGRRLMDATVQAAQAAGIERIELGVFATNSVAASLYRSCGFVQEGVQRGARKIDGRYDDQILMALVVGPGF
jgi:RimJ/RimL family protein N-acetyltransferase